MRRQEDYLPTRRTQGAGLTPGGQIGGFGFPFLGGSPWQMMRRMQEDMDRMFGQFFGGPAPFGGGLPAEGQMPALQQWMPSVDVSETDKEWCIEADLPGVKKDDIEVQVRDQYLILRARLNPDQESQGSQGTPGDGGKQGEQEKKNGQSEQGAQRQYHQRERRWGYFERVLSLPDNADEEKISCDFENGVLALHVPKTETAAPQARRIPIGVGEHQSSSSRAGGSQAAQSPQGEPATAGSGAK